MPLQVAKGQEAGGALLVVAVVVHQEVGLVLVAGALDQEVGEALLVVAVVVHHEVGSVLVVVTAVAPWVVVQVVLSAKDRAVLAAVGPQVRVVVQVVRPAKDQAVLAAVGPQAE